MPKKSGIKFPYELRKNKEWSRIGRDDGSRARRTPGSGDLGKSRKADHRPAYVPRKPVSESYANMVKRELECWVEEAAAKAQESAPALDPSLQKRGAEPARFGIPEALKGRRNPPLTQTLILLI
jgi:hypothetical protein